MRNNPQKPKQAVIVACLMLGALVAAGHMLSFSASSYAMYELRNSLHAPAFALLSLALYFVLRSSTGARTAIVGAAIGSALTAATGEFLQAFGPGDASLADLARDAIGVSGALLLLVAVDDPLNLGPRRFFRAVIFLVSLMLGGATLAPAAYNANAFVSRATSFPIIISFDHDWEKIFYNAYKGATVARVPLASDGNLVALIAMGGAGYSGLEIEPYPNWTGYNALRFTASTIDGQPARLNVRIHDAKHTGHYTDRFRRTFEINATSKEFLIPLAEISTLDSGRRMRFDNIRSIIFYMVDTEDTKKIIIDDIRLLAD